MEWDGLDPPLSLYVLMLELYSRQRQGKQGGREIGKKGRTPQFAVGTQCTALPSAAIPATRRLCTQQRARWMRKFIRLPTKGQSDDDD